MDVCPGQGTCGWLPITYQPSSTPLSMINSSSSAYHELKKPRLWASYLPSSGGATCGQRPQRIPTRKLGGHGTKSCSLPPFAIFRPLTTFTSHLNPRHLRMKDWAKTPFFHGQMHLMHGLQQNSLLARPLAASKSVSTRQGTCYLSWWSLRSCCWWRCC